MQELANTTEEQAVEPVKNRGGRPKKAALPTDVEGLEALSNGLTLKDVKLRDFSVTDLLEAKFVTYEFEGSWADAFGRWVERNFSCLIYGDPKQGKTNFCLAFAMYLTQFCKNGSGGVYYNTHEQGKSQSLQTAAKRLGIDLYAGKIKFGWKESFLQMVARLSKPNSPSIVFIDSLDSIKLTHRQYRYLRDNFPNKAFIMICWGKGKHPRRNASQEIRYEVDAVAYVKDFIAFMESRFDGGENYIIWEEGAIRRGALKAALENSFYDVTDEDEPEEVVPRPRRGRRPKSQE